MAHALLQFFDYERQSPELQEVCRPFHAAAHTVDAAGDQLNLRGDEWERVIDPLIALLEKLPKNSERAQAGRHLRSLKATVRAYPNGEGGTTPTVFLRQLLQAKESVVRSVFFQEQA